MNIQPRQRTALVAYGSETGNAQDCANEIGQLAERLHFGTRVESLEALDPHLLTQFGIVIILISTAGEGDLPNNAQSFWKSLLRKKLPPSYLERVLFTTFGLGDTSYVKLV